MLVRGFYCKTCEFPFCLSFLARVPRSVERGNSSGQLVYKYRTLWSWTGELYIKCLVKKMPGLALLLEVKR